MSLEVSTIALITILLFGVSGIVFFQNRKNPLSRAYSLFVFTVAGWGLGVTFFLLSREAGRADFWARVLYLFGGSTGPAFYYFTFVFSPRRDGAIAISRPHALAIIAPSLTFLFLYFFSDLVVRGVVLESPRGTGFLYGPLHYLFDAHIWTFFILALIVFIKKYLRATGDEKTQLLYVNLGTYLSLSIAGVTNIILPSLVNEFRLIWMGPPATIIIIILLGYAITKHHLFNIRVISAQIFVVLLGITLLINAMISNTLPQLVFRGLIFIAVAVLGYFLLRSVLSEVRQREKLEVLSKELAVANEELKQLDAAKSEFVSIAGHQLRTPLTAIKGFTSMVVEGSYGALAEKAKGALEKVMFATEQLVKLVDSLLDLSRIEAGKISYDFKPGNLTGVIEEVIGMLSPKAESNNVTITFTNDVKKAPLLAFDYDKLREVIVNLVDNAIKYSRQGKTLVKQELTSGGKNRKLRVSVTDTGIGIKKEDLERIFTKFVRTEEARVADPNGMGIGLYFVKRVVEDHGGKVWAESAGVGKGSTFVVELPIKG